MRGKRTLEESLDFYVQGELMEGDNQYLCEELGKKVGALLAPAVFLRLTGCSACHLPFCIPILYHLQLGGVSRSHIFPTWAKV